MSKVIWPRSALPLHTHLCNCINVSTHPDLIRGETPIKLPRSGGDLDPNIILGFSGLHKSALQMGAWLVHPFLCSTPVCPTYKHRACYVYHLPERSAFMHRMQVIQPSNDYLHCVSVRRFQHIRETDKVREFDWSGKAGENADLPEKSWKSRELHIAR